MTAMFRDLSEGSSDRKRRELLSDVVNYTESGKMRKGFTADFYSYMEDLNLSMMEKGGDFFARFTQRMDIEMDYSIKWPMATVISGRRFLLKINPIIFLFQREEEAAALLKHEILHIILDHHRREKALKSHASTLAINLALDVAVNQHLRNLPSFCQRLSSVNLMLNLDLKPGETLEFYTFEIDKSLKEDPYLKEKYKEKNGIDYNEVHNAWSEGEDLEEDAAKEKFRGIMEYSLKGGTPEEIKGLLEGLKKGSLSWQEIIKREIMTAPSGKRKTVTRRNRRQPERLDLRGELSNHIPEIIAAIDTSASVTDREVRKYIGEILNLTGRYRKPLRIILCDESVTDDYRIKGIDGLKNLGHRRRGTRFSPVFELLKNEGNTNCLLIYFTDGMGEKKLSVKPQHNTFFIVSGEELSLEKPPGRVIYLQKEERKDSSGYGLEAMRELLHEWAR